MSLLSWHVDLRCGIAVLLCKYMYVNIIDQLIQTLGSTLRFHLKFLNLFYGITRTLFPSSTFVDLDQDIIYPSVIR